MSNAEFYRIRAGADETLALTARKRNKTIQDLTGGTLTLKLFDRDGNEKASLSGTITSATDGTWGVSFAQTTADGLIGDYDFLGELDVSDVKTIVNSGRVVIEKGIS